MHKNIVTLIFLILLSAPELLFCQVTIIGPTCAATETVYQYNIQGSWDSASTMQVCVTGGVIADSSVTGNCTAAGAPLGAVMITWGDSSGGSLSVTSSKGTATLQVAITSALQPGRIDSTDIEQIVDSGSSPRTISCSPATGGACSPAYTYYWQQSADAMSWSDIPAGNQESLGFSQPVTQTVYYRRKITETVSGTIGYSDTAAITVPPGNH